MNDNDVVIEAWNTVLFDKFLRFKHLIVAGLSGHSDELLSGTCFVPAIACSILVADSATPRPGLPAKSAPVARPSVSTAR